MPLKRGSSRKVISENIREMQAAGHPHDQAVAASLRNADQSRKGNHMAKKPYGHEGGMDGSKGMSPRKAMASGGGGNFGVEPFHEHNDGTGIHPDHAAHTGAKGAMMDHERGSPPGVHHTKGHHPAQAAPVHGHTHPGGHGHHHHYDHEKA